MVDGSENLNLILEKLGDEVVSIKSVRKANSLVDHYDMVIRISGKSKARASERAKSLGLKTLSSYIRLLMHADFEHEILVGVPSPEGQPKEATTEGII